MAEKRTINIDINSNASEAEKDFKSFNKAVDETTKSAKNLDATFEEVYGELQPLTTRMGEAEDRLYELSLAGDTTSKEFQELLTKVGEYRKVQIQTDLAVDGAAQTMTQKLGSALNGATSGFAATQGAMALFGSENQALEQSLLKVQSALAIQQGVKGLSDAYKELSIGTKLAGAAQYVYTTAVGTSTGAMKLFRLALISTGIGAIVVGISLLVANFDKVKKAVSNAISSFEKLGPVMKLILLPITVLVEGFKLVKKGLQAIGVLESDEEKQRKERGAEELRRIEEQRKAREEAFNDRQKQFDREIALLNAEGKATFKLSQTKIKASIDYQKELIKEKELVLSSMEQALKGAGLESVANELTKEQRKELKELNESVLDSENQLKINVLNNNKEKTDSYKDYAASRLSIARQIEDIENGLLKDGIEKELEINRDKFRRLREDAKKNTKLTTQERATLIDLRNQEEAQAEAKIIADNQKRREDAFETERSERVELLNFVDELNTAEVESEKAKNLAILDNAVETNEKLIESDKAVAEAKKNIQDAQIANVEAGISLLKDVAGENNKLQALAIAAENAVGIAKIIISTQAANAAAKLKYAAIPGGLALAAAEITANKVSAGIGIAASVAAAAKGIASLKASASLDSGGSLGGGGAGTEAAVPQFNVVGDSGINQIAALQSTPTQAYVVSGEVTTSQALDRNRVQNATL